MGLFGNQFANVIEWEEYNDDMLFRKWSNKEIKKDSRLIFLGDPDEIKKLMEAVANQGKTK